MSLEEWQKPLARKEPGSSWNFDHPILATILSVRRANAANFKREGREWEGYDQAVLDCYHALDHLLCGLDPAKVIWPEKEPKP